MNQSYIRVIYILKKLRERKKERNDIYQRNAELQIIRSDKNEGNFDTFRKK